jgi:hypothetical protein
MVEVPVQSAQHVGAAYHGGVNDRVIVWVGRHDARSRAGKNEFRDSPRAKITEILGYLFVRQFGRCPDPFIREDALQFLEEEGRQKQHMSR